MSSSSCQIGSPSKLETIADSPGAPAPTPVRPLGGRPGVGARPRIEVGATVKSVTHGPRPEAKSELSANGHRLSLLGAHWSGLTVKRPLSTARVTSRLFPAVFRL